METVGNSYTLLQRWTNVPKDTFLGKQLLINPGKKKVGLLYSSTAYSSIQYLTRLIPQEYFGPKLKGLKTYLNHTFMRVSYEEKVKQFRYEDFLIMVWNTGLLSKYHEAIYCIMIPYGYKGMNLGYMSTTGEEDWFIKVFATEADIRKLFFMQNMLLSNLHPDVVSKLEIVFRDEDELPPRASYFSNCHVDQIVFNSSIPISKGLDIQHLLGFTPDQQRKRRSRLPQKFRNEDDQTLASRIRQGIETMRIRLTYNYRLAIPHYFLDKNALEGEIQLLCPIYLSFEKLLEDEVCISLRLIKGSQGEPKEYRIVSLLSKEQAYINARLLQYIDQEWIVSEKYRHFREMYPEGMDIPYIPDTKQKKRCKYHPHCKKGNTCDFSHE